MNDNIGPERVVLSYRVFGCILRFCSTESTLQMQQQRMDAMQAAWREMAIITAEIRIRKALSSRVPRNADLVIEVGDLVWVYRETDIWYVGPHSIIRVYETHVFTVDNYQKKSSISTEYFQPPHMKTSFRESTLWVLWIYRLRSYRPIVHSNLLPLTAKISQASSLRRFYVTMMLECEVSKLIKHESKN